MIQFGNDPTGAYFQPRPDCIAPSRATPYKNFAGGGYVWFDPTTMAIPGPGKLGSCGISSERGPGLKQIDMSLSKTIQHQRSGRAWNFASTPSTRSIRRSSP